MHQRAIGNLPFGALAKDALQIGNWIGRIGERIGPLLLEMRMNDLPHNRVPQIFFALEVMKQCALGLTRPTYDAIEATALESVFVKFVKRSLENFSSRVFSRSGRGCLHSSLTIQTSRYVSTFKFQIFLSHFEAAGILKSVLILSGRVIVHDSRRARRSVCNAIDHWRLF